MTFSKASRYLLAVSATTSSGMLTSSLPLRPELVSQSRRYCYSMLVITPQDTAFMRTLSYEDWPLPISYLSAGQKRELSGVRTSSTSTISPDALSSPNSSFVSAMMMPRSSAYCLAYGRK